MEIFISLEDWYQVEKLLPRPKKKPDGPGRPVCDFQQVFRAIIWVLKSGARWKDLPDYFPSYQTCHRRFQQWTESGVFRLALSKLVRRQRHCHKLDLCESYVDGSFIPAKKGGTLVKSSLKGKGSKLMALLDRSQVPLSLSLTSANRHDVSQVPQLLKERFIWWLPKKIVGDKAFDSDPLDKELLRRGIQLIAPDRDCKLVATQDRRALCRCKRRWCIERYFSRLKGFRRVATRWEQKAQNYLALVHLAALCLMIVEF